MQYPDPSGPRLCRNTVRVPLRQQACVIMMIADALVPYRHQGICNHHADIIMFMVSYKYFYELKHSY